MFLKGHKVYCSSQRTLVSKEYCMESVIITDNSESRTCYTHLEIRGYIFNKIILISVFTVF